MNFLGFYLGRHDTNMTLVSDGIVKYFKAERIFGIKHEFRSINWVKNVCKQEGFVPDAVAYSDGDRNGLGQCEKNQLFKKTTNLFDVSTYCLDHYYAHILSAWPVVDMKKVKVGIGIDGKGDHRMSRRTIVRPGDLNRAKTVEYCEGVSIGRFFAKVGKRMGLKAGVLDNGIKLTMDYAGKVMGAHAYGKEIDMPVSKKKALNSPYDMFKYVPSNYSFKNKNFLNWLATAHKKIGRGILSHFGEYCKPNDCIVYSGGVAQNTVYNDQLFRAYPNLYIPPHCYDGGMSLGCVEFLRLRYEREQFNKDNFPYWQRDIIEECPSEKTINKVSELLARNKIVGWFQGAGEIGPRALGNRSILMHPAMANGKDILNKRVKNREFWRPYAPSVLEDYAPKWFDIDRPSPYMLRTVLAKNPKAVSAVVHVDKSSRIQTVWGGIYEMLIKKFYLKTEIPMLLNTSFNGGGEPIFSTPEQCLNLFKRTNMDAVCIGNKLYEK